MSGARLAPIARTWLGLVALLSVAVSVGWLLALWVPTRLAEPGRLAFVESLREQARTDADVQKILQPETERQTQALLLQRTQYSRLGLFLIISAGTFVAWARWLRPDQGTGVGAPAVVLRLLERRPDKPAAAPPSRFRVSGDGTQPESLVRPGIENLPLPAVEETPDLGPIEKIIRTEGRERQAIIPVLQAIQAQDRYLPHAALQRVCEATDITPAQLTGVATFYDQFRHEPVGEHIIRVCEGTACHVLGAAEVGNEVRRWLAMPDGSDTDPSRLFTIERVACIGSCSLAPVMTIDEKICGHVSALSASGVVRGFLEAKLDQRANGNGKRRPSKVALRPASAGGREHPIEIRIGLGSCGIASGALEVQEAVEDAVSMLGGGALVKPVGCSGFCHREPLIEIVQNGSRVLYGNVSPGDVRRIVRKHVKPHGLVRSVRESVETARARLFDDAAWIPEEAVDATPYMGKQVRVVLENCGHIDPASLEEYQKSGGMRALEECLTRLSPQEIIEKVRTSGLRGRGGAGFPTAVKWDIGRRAQGSKKYVICNGDEGDPGAFMDRAVLESDPFRVIEGLVIAAYAIGADEGFVYVRREYPIAVRHIRAAIEKAEARGILGTHIFGSPFSFTLRVREGAGAFVCGEETALIQSIEGERGAPRLRPPFPAQAGLWGKPTIINNVETLACLPWIIRKGPESFAAMGTEKSKGTKVFSLAGKVNRGGLIEVPMGITIREIVEDIGGGIKGGRPFKAVLCGGPSGGCIPARLADTRIDYQELASTGAIMGSGGLVVLDDRDCAVEIARYFLHFTQSESCGKCTFCRVGTKRMLEILERISAGTGREADLQTLEDLSLRVKAGSLCGLGQTAPNPVLTTLRYFRDEYEAHIRERRCPAAQCKDLIHYTVLDSCTGCTLCAQACPTGAIEARPYEIHKVVDDRCTRCGMCVTACPESAIGVA